MNKRFLMFLCFVMLSLSSAFAQFKVTGIVTDAKDGSPIAFASVVVKGTTTGVAADADGKYSISATSSDVTLIFSSIGYVNQEIEVKGKAVVNAALASDSEALDEVMVVAYGTATKTAFTGSAGKVSGDKIELVPATNPLNTLNGSTPGIRLTSSLGQPGADATITVRGIGSLNGNTDPLIVLDGMIYSGVLSSIPAGDIEQITVLKDAASTALYGSRAANGVIMITTRQGKGDQPTIKVNVAHGWVSREQANYAVQNDKQYMETYWQMYYNNYKAEGGLTDDEARLKASTNVVAALQYNDDYMAWSGPGVTASNVVGTDGKFNPNASLLWADDVDWQGAVEQVGQVQDYSVSASGRSNNSTYFGSVGYTNQEGYVIGSGFERFSGRANVSFQKNWFKMGVNVSAQMSKRYGIQSTSQGDMSNPFHTTLKTSPMYPIHRHRADGSYVLDKYGQKIYDFGEGYSYTYEDGTVGAIPPRQIYSGSNAVKYCEARSSDQTRHILNVKPYFEINFLKDFKLTFNGAIYNSDYKAKSATPWYPEKSAGTTTSSITNTNTQTYSFNQLFNWGHDFGNHHVDALLGHESNAYIYYTVGASKKNQIVLGDNYEFDNYTEQNAVSDGYRNTYNTEGYFARVNYDFSSKYFLSASFRRDGSSKFHASSRWGNFWSLGGSSVLTNEKWMKGVSWVDMLKLRASVGTVGSDDLGSYYPHMALYTANQNGTEAGYTQNRESPGNPNLQWEVSDNWDAAVEFQLFNRRLNGSVEYFHRQTTNLLMDVTLASSTGLSSYRDNDGGILNHGLEMQLNFDIIRTKKVNWNVGANASVIKNRITYLPVDPYTFNSNFNKVQEGHSVYEWWLYQWAGVDSNTGYNLYELGAAYYNEDGSLVAGIDENPMVTKVDGKYYTYDIAKAKEEFSGSSIPKVYGGVTSNLRIGRFTFDLNLYYQLGGYTYDRAYSNLMAPGVHTTEGANVHVDMLNAWKNPGDVTDVPILVSKSSSYAENVKGLRSTQWRTSTNMLEINNLTAAYDFPAKLCNAIKISGLKLYVAADHLAIWTARKGLFANYSLSNYDSGGSRYAPSRTVTVGLNLTL